MTFVEKLGKALGGLSAKTLVAAIYVLLMSTAIVSLVDIFQNFMKNPSISANVDLYKQISSLERKIKLLESKDYNNVQFTKSTEASKIYIIEQKQRELEIALGNDLEKAISIAMLRRDIEDIKSNHINKIVILESRVESIFQQLLWISGSLITLLIAEFGWTLSRKSKVLA
jgi:hypothetical protein